MRRRTDSPIGAAVKSERNCVRVMFSATTPSFCHNCLGPKYVGHNYIGVVFSATMPSF